MADADPVDAEEPADSIDPVLAQFARPTAETSTRIAVLSDLHLTDEETGTWRVSHRTEDRLEATVESLNRTADLDAVCFVGDLVQSGTRAEYEAFDRILAGLEVPFYAVPGNHDLLVDDSRETLSLSEFERRYTPGELPYHQRIGGVDLLALNSNRSTRDSLAESYTGRLEPETLEWLAERLETVSNPLVAVHHNLPGTRDLLWDSLEQLPVSGGSPDFENADELVDVLEGADGARAETASGTVGPLVLTGHLHFPAVTSTRGVREFTLPSLGPYPNAYTILEIDERGTTATMRSVSDYGERLESFTHGLEHSRVMLAATQLAGLPLVDDLSEGSGGFESGSGSESRSEPGSESGS
ncbi:metallophosphoesterase family protein [Halomontanus rarus]|uniref:metallophosphoesterase family protein n=1 Tax=Halomontanus rarus TaxID=3034020 RepID=UPI0023E8921D|nr:metallophosphoesterase [Halovivax sp. TS33]